MFGGFHVITSVFHCAGVYGDVIRVKILYNKKDNALLQYSEPTQAQLGNTLHNSHGVWLYRPCQMSCFNVIKQANYHYHLAIYFLQFPNMHDSSSAICNILFFGVALTHLDKIKVWGKQIRVAPSKHPIVQMPTDLQADGAKLTKDYTNSPLHRYKKKGSKNYQNIYPPSATLHLSNIP